MRICYLCPDSGVELSKYNGSAAHVRGLVGAFAGLGHQVDLLMPRVEGADDLGVRVVPIPRAPFVDSLNALARKSRPLAANREETTAVLRALRRIWLNSGTEQVLGAELTRHPPDLIYERYSPYCAAGSVIARRMGLPHVLEVNAPLAWEGARHRGQALNEAADVLEALAFEATARIVAVSEELRGFLVEAGVDASKIRVMPNAVDPQMFSAEGPSKREGLEGKFVVGFVGSLKAWHGIEVLAQAFAELAGDLRLHLLVVGDGPNMDLLRELADRHPGQVTLAGAVHPSEVPAYLRAMDITVAPYPAQERFYFSPLKVLESMAAGRAVVASRIGQIGKLVVDGETGLLVEPGDVQALVGAVRRLVGDEDLSKSLGRQAAREIRRSHVWSRRAEEILDMARAVA